MKRMRKMVIVLLAVIMGTFSLAMLTGCTGGLANGTYSVTTVLLDGQEQHEDSSVFISASTIQFVVRGNNFTLVSEAVPLPITVQFRVRNGYLEQRHSEMHGGMWVRENGTVNSGFVSTRVENGMIVGRHFAGSFLYNTVGGVVEIFYSR